MRIIETNVYEFDELSEEGKEKARLEHIKFLLETSSNYFDYHGNVIDKYKDYFVVKAIIEMDKMQTPWFLTETIYHDYREEIDGEIKINDYEFTIEGDLVCLNY